MKLIVFDQTSENELGVPATIFFNQCDFGSLNYIKFVFQGVSIIAGLLMTYITSDIAAPFNEGLWM